ncbi:hypothetical protein NK6_2624 [Bradyrhizobium diazoefficiens]|uniref:Uncharacterized protein n=1 Tax=Bradyrhizobium diazoefficiens TaxID=1355477 RepID=A0A0E3VTK2_9BRAD|nr:hypothetical protein NK6_2624 [Bradyrhizobium diazoefficiens]
MRIALQPSSLRSRSLRHGAQDTLAREIGEPRKSWRRANQT